MKIGELKGFFLEMLYPNRCMCCDVVLRFQSTRGCCENCEEEVDALILRGNVCQRCGKHHERKSEPYCFDCQKRDHLYHQGRGVFAYSPKIKEGIYRLKYEEKPDLAISFAKELISYYNQYITWSIDYIIPVPLHRRRYQERGYNQSELLAKHLGAAIGIEVKPKWLKRVVATLPQKDLDERGRHKNLSMAIRCSTECCETIKNKRILIMDDIYTTGATINACADALLEQGAQEVYFLTLAIGDGY